MRGKTNKKIAQLFKLAYASRPLRPSFSISVLECMDRMYICPAKPYLYRPWSFFHSKVSEQFIDYMWPEASPIKQIYFDWYIKFIIVKLWKVGYFWPQSDKNYWWLKLPLQEWNLISWQRKLKEFLQHKNNFRYWKIFSFCNPGRVCLRVLCVYVFVCFEYLFVYVFVCVYVSFLCVFFVFCVFEIEFFFCKSMKNWLYPARVW